MVFSRTEDIEVTVLQEHRYSDHLPILIRVWDSFYLKVGTENLPPNRREKIWFDNRSISAKEIERIWDTCPLLPNFSDILSCFQKIIQPGLRRKKSTTEYSNPESIQDYIGRVSDQIVNGNVSDSFKTLNIKRYFDEKY